ncbi:hypothetical protein F2Q70_00029646 [Brassica cretica]|uniref:Uncharacterized protein n=1 Tax=Brassica cretica TaxID=69181 RepID=A0A8S9GW92_BRACR|nr:hypothetical protein F2Q70_00029646 [Brassica cretica]KAF2549819.1 hypothetical protein F2Q68_00034080 [Brassica cretica]
MGSSRWCRLIPPAEQRSTPHVEHRFPPPSEQRSTQPAEYVGSQQTASIDRCYSDDDRYYTPTTISRPRLRSIDRHRLYADRYSSQTRTTVDWNQQLNYSRRPPEYNAPEPVVFPEAADGQVPVGRRRRNKIPKHLRRAEIEKKVRWIYQKGLEDTH